VLRTPSQWRQTQPHALLPQVKTNTARWVRRGKFQASSPPAPGHAPIISPLNITPIRSRGAPSCFSCKPRPTPRSLRRGTLRPLSRFPPSPPSVIFLIAQRTISCRPSGNSRRCARVCTNTTNTTPPARHESAGGFAGPESPGRHGRKNALPCRPGPRNSPLGRRHVPPRNQPQLPPPRLFFSR